MKLKQPLCHIFGHTEEDQDPDLDTYLPTTVYAGMNREVVATKYVYCGKCGEQIGAYDQVDPPPGEHQGLVLERHDMFDDMLRYKAFCWCGWQSNTWFGHREYAQGDLDGHCTKAG